jgi:hypothetical protein
MSGPTLADLAGEYADEDADGNLLLIGTEDDGRVYLSVNDQHVVTLTADAAEAAGRELLARAAAARGPASGEPS